MSYTSGMPVGQILCICRNYAMQHTTLLYAILCSLATLILTDSYLSFSVYPYGRILPRLPLPALYSRNPSVFIRLILFTSYPLEITVLCCAVLNILTRYFLYSQLMSILRRPFPCYSILGKLGLFWLPL